MCVGFSPPSNSLTPAECPIIQFNSDTNGCECRLHRLRAQSHKVSLPFKMQVASSRCPGYSNFCLTWLLIRGSHDLSLPWIWLFARTVTDSEKYLCQKKNCKQRRTFNKIFQKKRDETENFGMQKKVKEYNTTEWHNKRVLLVLNNYVLINLIA